MARVLDRQFVEIEFLLHLQQLCIGGVTQGHPDEAIRSDDVVADVRDGNIGELSSILVGNAVDQHIVPLFPSRSSATAASLAAFASMRAQTMRGKSVLRRGKQVRRCA